MPRKMEYRMVLVPPHYSPEDTASLMAQLQADQRWVPVTFVPRYAGDDGVITGHMLMSRVVHEPEGERRPEPGDPCPVCGTPMRRMADGSGECISDHK